MPRSDNPFDLINALEDRYKELTMNACTDINASTQPTEKYLDVDGVFGVPGHEITWDQIVDYWNNNCNDDPILAEYPSFDPWWMATKEQLTPIEDCTAINAAVDDIEEVELDADDFEVQEVADKIVKYNIATQDEIDLVEAVTDDWSIDMLNKIINARTGYDDIESYIGEVYPDKDRFDRTINKGDEL